MTFAASILGGGLSIAGGLVGAAGARQSANASWQASVMNADMMGVRAAEAERNRGIALANAEMEARDTKVKNRAMMGAIRAAYGANGLAMEGSPLDVIEATATEQSLDIAKILYKGDLEAVALTDQAASYRQQEKLYRMGGSNALIAGEYSATASLLSGFAGAAKSFTSAAGSL